jgi:hypothetical protein
MLGPSTGPSIASLSLHKFGSGTSLLKHEAVSTSRNTKGLPLLKGPLFISRGIIGSPGAWSSAVAVDGHSGSPLFLGSF